MSMNELKERSIHIPNGRITTIYPQFNAEETIDISELRSKFNGNFSANNSTICYVSENEIYVTPYTRSAMATLMAEGFTEKYFFVPFSNWDYPKYEKERWAHLRMLARESYDRDYEFDSTDWCKEHGISMLDEEVLKRCFRIPREGVPVKHPSYETVIYPACSESCVDSTVINRLGRYCTNNGKVAFVYCDGHTYVTKGYWIVSKLREAGYREAGLFVPFSNGEAITDPRLAYAWDKIVNA